MTPDRARLSSKISSKSVSIEEHRHASWLLSNYSDHIWIVSDSRDHKQTENIQFGERMADGRLLTDIPRLYATVKEYAWWLRDARFSRIDDALSHATMVRNMIYLTHALTLRGIWSFPHLQPYDIDQLVESCRYGSDALIMASDRVDEFLKNLEAKNAQSSNRFGGLPQLVSNTTGRRYGRVDRGQIMAMCNLPDRAKTLKRVSFLIDKYLTRFGSGTPDRETPYEMPPLKNVTVQALQRWLDPLEQLYVMRRHISAEAITFKPFPYGAARVAAIKGVGTARTPTPPPMLVLHLLEHSARWLFEHEQQAVTKVADRSSVLCLATACWILIATFTARRDDEIDDLRLGCLRGDMRSGWWLQIYIEKTLQRTDWIPVPELVARSIGVLESISEAARRTNGSNQLFQWLNPAGEIVRLDVGRHLDDFAKLIEVPGHRSRDGSIYSWHWHPHQFRRFFSVFYFYRFEGATIEALSHHLRHFNIEMTRSYVTQDKEVAALWTDVEWGYTGHVARSIVAGERSISGTAGERLKRTAKRLIDIYRRKLQVASPERVGASLALVMKRQGMVLTPKPWVTCTCPKSLEAARTAACRRGKPAMPRDLGPDFAHAGPTICSACPHAVTESSRQEFLTSELAYMAAADSSETRSGTLIKILEQQRLIDLKRVLETRYRLASPVSAPSLDREPER